MCLILLLLIASFTPPDPAERISILQSGHHLRRPGISSDQPVDFLTYSLDITVNPDSCSISGSVTMTASPLEDIDTIFIDLADTLTTEAIYVDGAIRSFIHDNDRIVIPGNPIFTMGDTLTLEVRYRGVPVAEGFGSFICNPRGEVPQFWTLSQTDYARTWWPCHDTPSDKAMVTVHISVPYTPEECRVVSNGICIGMYEEDGYTTYTWKEQYPIAPYLVSLAGTNYSAYTDSVQSISGEHIPVEYYIYPENEAEALEDLSVTPAMITAFEKRYGSYPFQGEKYATALVARSGAMEHQTATSYGDVHIRGDHYFDWIIAHELAHQWWGDWVTCDSWDHIWLNEGLASFSEAVWVEDVWGPEAYKEYMRSQDYLLTSGNEFPGTVLYPEYEFSITVYDKGAWIVHMLRQMTGDEVFFRSLNEYGSSFAYSTARTPDLVSVFESQTGTDLQWFFDQWLLREGRPHLALSWERTRTFVGDSIRLQIDQIQNDLPYRFPLDLLFSGVTEDSLISVEVISAREEYDVFMPFQVTTWTIDPDSRVLLTVDDGPGDPNAIHPMFVVYPPFPNPFEYDIHFGLDLPEPDVISLKICNMAGYEVWNSGRIQMNAGSSEITWSGNRISGIAPSGAYLAILKTGTSEHVFRIIRLK